MQAGQAPGHYLGDDYHLPQQAEKVLLGCRELSSTSMRIWTTVRWPGCLGQQSRFDHERFLHHWFGSATEFDLQIHAWKCSKNFQANFKSDKPDRTEETPASEKASLAMWQCNGQVSSHLTTSSRPLMVIVTDNRSWWSVGIMVRSPVYPVRLRTGGCAAMKCMYASYQQIILRLGSRAEILRVWIYIYHLWPKWCTVPRSIFRSSS